jgi:hypothetical protein
VFSLLADLIVGEILRSLAVFVCDIDHIHDTCCLIGGYFALHLGSDYIGEPWIGFTMPFHLRLSKLVPGKSPELPP